ncbi:HAD-IA family hydrolase [Streptomyces sp. A1547]|uniref:HAD family hydrolase n=1 Tax=Streptomyces sp. A1547 TaxID=2563105 RepID=UPI00109E4CD7|nr:HAD-IA family hydrolase [Streptomyces sp. A1547]THA30536.1 HAD family hydrolase [Streptomyces sp. A1547]
MAFSTLVDFRRRPMCAGPSIVTPTWDSQSVNRLPARVQIPPAEAQIAPVFDVHQEGMHQQAPGSRAEAAELAEAVYEEGVVGELSLSHPAIFYRVLATGSPPPPGRVSDGRAARVGRVAEERGIHDQAPCARALSIYPRIATMDQAIAPPWPLGGGTVTEEPEQGSAAIEGPKTGAVRGVLFDFSGTLFGRLPGHDWLFDGLEGQIPAVDQDLREQIVHTLRYPDAVAAQMSTEQRADWAARDLSATSNRRAYAALFRLAGLADAEVFASVFQRLNDPGCWFPYADARPALERLKAAGVRVGVLSNIAWDIRAAFARHGLDVFVDAFVLSYEEGRCKPDPIVFAHACERLGASPGECLLVGDDPVTDGGATAAGLSYAQVATGPVGVRPLVLQDVLDNWKL